MKKFIPFICFLAMSFSSLAQLPAGSTAPDFTANDITGQSHNLYSMLNAGKAVVLDFSATWCGSCWSYHNSGALKTFYTNHGPNSAANDGRVLFIEDICNNSTGCLYGSGGGGTPFQACSGSSTQGNWVSNTNYPIIDNCTISGSYAVQFYPTIYMVCPNKKVYSVGTQSAASLESKMQTLCGMTSNPPMSYSVNSTTNITCFNGSNGAISIAANGGQAPLTYKWSNNATTASINNLSANTYSCTITDANNATLVTTPIVLTQGTAVVATSTITNHQACGTTGAINLSTSGGIAPYSYSWSNNATTKNLSNITQSGTYAVSISDSNGCTSNINGLVITANNNQPIANAGLPQSITCTQNQVTLAGTVLPLSTNYAYTWSLVSGTSQLVSGINSLTSVANGTGVFQLSIKDNLSLCSSVSTVAVTSNLAQPSAAIAQNGSLNCINNSVGLSVNLCPTCTVTWSGGTLVGSTNSVNVSLPNSYKATVVNSANGCSASNTIVVTENKVLPIISTLGNDLELNCKKTVVNFAPVVSAVTSPTFSWTSAVLNNVITGPSASNASVIAPGTYTLAVTNPNNGCTATKSVVVTENKVLPVISSLGNALELHCNKAIVDFVPVVSAVTNPAFLWTSSSVNNTVTNPLTANASVESVGTYTLVVTNPTNGCTATKSAIVTESEVPNMTLIASATICYADCNGKVIPTITKGKAPFSYKWSNAATTSQLTNLCAGDYLLTVTDAYGCTVSEVTKVTQPNVLAATTAIKNQMGDVLNSGSVSLTPTGGTKPYTYLWSNGVTAQNNINVKAGTYECEITDANGCKIKVVAVVKVTSGVDHIEALESLSISPNPTQNNVSIQLVLKQTATIELSIIDVSGKVIQHIPMRTGQTFTETFDFTSFPYGVYMINFYINGQILSRKIVKQ